MQRVSGKVVRLAAIGTAAGAFSGLFGVGGGALMVPLLLLWLAYEEREATGTSLAAIVIIAAFAAVGQAFAGNVDFLKGVLIGLPGGGRSGCRRGAPAAAPAGGRVVRVLDLPACLGRVPRLLVGPERGAPALPGKLFT